VALVRRPGPRLVEGIVSHQDPIPVDYDLALRQWSGYVDALQTAGWSIDEVEPVDDCPDAVFVEDAVVVFDDLAVITSPGAETRRAETDGAARAVRRLGLDVATITAGTLDGGDVLKVGRTVYVGLSARTDATAVAQLGGLIAGRGWRVVPVPVTRVLHLKSMITALPDGTIIGYQDLLDPDVELPSFLPVPEPAGAHVVLLGGERLLMAADAPESAEQFRRLGYQPIEVDISEFEKLDGCVTCLSVRIRCELPVQAALAAIR
jgi:dimethylargininase